MPRQARGLKLGGKAPVGCEDAGHEQLGDGLDDARAANTGGEDGRDGSLAPEPSGCQSGKSGPGFLRRRLLSGRGEEYGARLPVLPVDCFPTVPLVAPTLTPDNLESDLEGGGVHPDALDGARRSAHAMTDLCALKSRAGGARGREELLAIAEQDFT